MAEATLHRRIVQACVIVAAVLCSAYALMTWIGVKMIEDHLLDNRLQAAASGLIRNHVHHERGPVAVDPVVYGDEEIPAAFRALQPGLYEIAIGQRVFHVLVRDQDGHRYAVVDDESEFERLEGQLWTALGAGFAACILLSLLLGVLTARRVIKPLADLAEAVAADRVNEDLPALARADEVGVLARALAAHQDGMRRFLTREQLFTGDVSHELRTPLTVMLGAAEVLVAQLDRHSPLAPFAERIRRTATETADRVSALLLLSRAPEALGWPRVKLGPLLEGEIDRCRPLLDGRPVRIELQVRGDSHAFGPPELMAIAVGNLVRNACNFTEQGYVRVTLEADQIVVDDSGPGIPAEVRSQLFERIAGPESRSLGTGLGLAIVQRVCEHLGWTVRLAASDSGGSRFCIGIRGSHASGSQ